MAEGVLTVSILHYVHRTLRSLLCVTACVVHSLHFSDFQTNPRIKDPTAFVGIA